MSHVNRLSVTKASRNVLAIDLGAESGRVVLCRWTGGRGTQREIHRFPNGAREENGHLLWDLEFLWDEILRGVSLAGRETQGCIDSLGIDGWGVDYVLLDGLGNRIGNAYRYRDGRNLPQMERAFSIVPKGRIDAITGIQFMPINTLFQLLAHMQEFPQEWEGAAFWLNLPEYFLFRLSGVAVAEYTNATTTQMLDLSSNSWSKELTGTLGLNLDKFPPIVPPGTVLGGLRSEIAKKLDLSQVKVIAPACHDTGSAVAGIPFPHDHLAFVSSGTWCLVGTVLPDPVVSDQAQQLNFTNEGGVGNSIRFLKNVIGLWLLQQCIAEWKSQGHEMTAARLAEECGEISMDGPYFNVASETFLAPGRMVDRINAGLAQEGFSEEQRPVNLADIIFRSLARRYADVIEEIRKITGKTLETVCIVGGGAKNEALNALTGKFTRLAVVKGPSEAAAVGNAAVQIAALENASLEQIEEIAKQIG